MTTATYNFVRGATTKVAKLAGFFSLNSASTDALRALNQWASDAPNRSFETVEDSDDRLVAKLTWDDNDIEPGQALEQHCEYVGVERHFVGLN